MYMQSMNQYVTTDEAFRFRNANSFSGSLMWWVTVWLTATKRFGLSMLFWLRTRSPFNVSVKLNVVVALATMYQMLGKKNFCLRSTWTVYSPASYRSRLYSTVHTDVLDDAINS